MNWRERTIRARNAGAFTADDHAALCNEGGQETCVVAEAFNATGLDYVETRHQWHAKRLGRICYNDIFEAFHANDFDRFEALTDEVEDLVLRFKREGRL